eukprot:jgi/Ulvmu1/1287/UM011_0011.1
MRGVTAGVGQVGIADSDTVSLSNLHRQIGHTEAGVGLAKTSSLQAAASAINSVPEIRTHDEGVTKSNAQALCQDYDVVADCSDNPYARYLVNDACVLAGVPLVSAAAVGTDGQLSVYAHNGGPCYRCIYPECPAPAHCTRCADAGVLGPVPGVMGTLQALECMKLLSGVGDPLSQALLLYDALSTRFTRIRLRARRPDCAACAPDSELRTTEGGPAGYDYAAFTGGHVPVEGGAAEASAGAAEGPGRITATALAQALGRHSQADPGDSAKAPLAAGGGCGGCADTVRPRAAAGEAEGSPGGRTERRGVVMVDVRPWELYQAARIPGAIHVGMREVEKRVADVQALQQQCGDGARVVVMCRRGNDSLVAAESLRHAGVANVVDLVGGIHAWADAVDASMPKL